MTNLSPLGDRVAVEPLKDDEVTPGGIYIPEIAQPRPSRGRVLAIGPKVTRVKPGHIVMFAKYGGVTVKIEGMDILLLKEDDLLATEE